MPQEKFVLLKIMSTRIPEGAALECSAVSKSKQQLYWRTCLKSFFSSIKFHNFTILTNAFHKLIL